MAEAISILHTILTDNEREILSECDELTLDFASLHKDSIHIISPQCVVIGYGELCDEFLELCVNQDSVVLEVSQLLPQDFVSVKGHLGAFSLRFKNANDDVESLETSQIVCSAPIELPECKGVHKPDMYANAQQMLQALLGLCGEQSYERNIIFNPTHCQFQLRRPLANGQSVCHSCVDICPTIGITSDKSARILELSAIDCIACGKCVSVCPTGSLWRDGDGFESFTYRARLYKGFIPLIVAQEAFERAEFYNDLGNLKNHNPLILPFVLQVPDMLNITYLLTLLQESGAPIVLYSPLGEHINDDIESLNIIYERIFFQRAIHSFADLQEVGALQPIGQTHYIYTPTSNESSKDILAERLRFWVKQESYGEVPMKNSALLNIDSQKCTLCLSCVEACNTKALINHQSRFELLHKALLCTDCGYCVSSCPEQVLSLESHTLKLVPQSFEYTTIASDEPFRCVECNQIFATRKSIEKIKHILSPAFSGNIAKLRSLECCADCKVKVMFNGVSV